ncbi:MAG TPA: ATP-binding protein [Solirubrobacteraceae bacterium]|nr:ATP-binding protein [Solirubrobacteraceae bacterium]
MEAGCPYDLCDGTGFVFDEDENVMRDCRCRARRKATRRARGLSHQIPKRYRGVGFDRYPVTEMHPTIVREVRRYCDRVGERLDRGDGLCLCGSRGTGKTTLAMLISQHALAARRSVAIYTAPALLAHIQATYGADAEHSYLGFMERLASVDLLHVEDLAVARQTEWVLEQLYTIVNRRYEDEKAIVFTADVDSPERLGDHVGERTYSRLIQMCGERVLPLHGTDQRIEARV